MVLSNAQRREARRITRKPPRGARTVTSAAVVAKAEQVPAGLDGLEWLISKRRLTPAQEAQAKAYRQDYHDAAEDGVTIKSGLDFQEGSSGKVAQAHLTAIINRDAAQKRLAHKRYTVLRGVVSVIELLDGVCGRRLRLTTMAGGNDRLAGAYEMVLKAALDMLANAG